VAPLPVEVFLSPLIPCSTLRPSTCNTQIHSLQFPILEAAMPDSHHEISDLEIESFVREDSISLFEAYSGVGEAVKALNAIKREDPTTPSWKGNLTKAQEDLRSSTAILGSHSRFSKTEDDKLWLDSINAQADPLSDVL
jgi:hypothetical protein